MSDSGESGGGFDGTGRGEMMSRPETAVRTELLSYGVFVLRRDPVLCWERSKGNNTFSQAFGRVLIPHFII